MYHQSITNSLEINEKVESFTKEAEVIKKIKNQMEVLEVKEDTYRNKTLPGLD